MINDNINFKLEYTTLWSFPERGNWATHSPKYRGNFAPQIPRNVILKYSKEGDTVLDPMVGGGTTLIEAKLLNRKGIGFDINPKTVELCKNNLKFEGDYKYKPSIKVGDVRDLKNIKKESIDLIITHPPYMNIIKYSNGEIEGDLSSISNIKKFCDELDKGIKEFFRVLKQDSYCAILIGDTRKSKHYIPLSNYVLDRFLDNGFALKEDIIKAQHNCESTPYWKAQANKYNIYLIMHEHLYIFRKPSEHESLTKIKYSMKMN
jgi:DNA modification methylase